MNPAYNATDLAAHLKEVAQDRSRMDRLTPGAYARPPREMIEWRAADTILAQAERIANLTELLRRAIGSSQPLLPWVVEARAALADTQGDGM